MAAPSTPDAIRDVNTRYHDGAAADYDAKWGIDWGEVGREQVLGKIRKALGGRLPLFERSLEVGAGTGYFSLHLLMAGVTREATCTDIRRGWSTCCAGTPTAWGSRSRRTSPTPRPSPSRTARSTWCWGTPCSITCLTWTAHSASSTASCARAASSSSPASPRATATASQASPSASPAPPRPPGVPRCGPARPTPATATAASTTTSSSNTSTCTRSRPSDLGGFARRAGFEDVNVRGEELLANIFGWTNRALETTAVPDEVPMAWKQYAFHGYLALQKVDGSVLEPRLPAALFYNLLLAARRPG